MLSGLKLQQHHHQDHQFKPPSSHRSQSTESKEIPQNATQVTHLPARPATSWLRSSSPQTRDHYTETGIEINIVEVGELGKRARGS
jgi:hypothetical protein